MLPLRYFFAFLLLAAFVWFVGFKYLFTKRCVDSVLRDLGVGRSKTSRTFQELKRKSFHLLGSLIPLIYFLGLKQTTWLNKRVASALMGFVTSFLWVVELLRLTWPAFFDLYNKIFGSMLRKRELQDHNKLTGTGFFFLGCYCCIRFFEPVVAIAAILFLVLGDLSAALVGVSLGRTKIVGNKSLEGTIAMFFTCFAVGGVCFWESYLWEYTVVVGSLVASVVELVCPPFVDDNLTIPVLASVAMHLALVRTGASAEGPTPLPN